MEKTELMNVLDKISRRLPYILLIAGVAFGFFSFFTNWEAFYEFDTSGFNFAFGPRHNLWYKLIGNHCYIPLVVFICSLLALVAVIVIEWMPKYRTKMFLLCLGIGVLMLLAMVGISVTKVCTEYGTFVFADRIGMGTRFAWISAVCVLNGGIMYTASHEKEDSDGK